MPTILRVICLKLKKSKISWTELIEVIEIAVVKVIKAFKATDTRLELGLI